MFSKYIHGHLCLCINIRKNIHNYPHGGLTLSLILSRRTLKNWWEEISWRKWAWVRARGTNFLSAANHQWLDVLILRIDGVVKSVINIKIPFMGIIRAWVNFLTFLGKSVYNARQNSQEIPYEYLEFCKCVIDRVKRQISKDRGFKKEGWFCWSKNNQ